MESEQIVLAKKVIGSLKKHWMKTNPHVRIIMNHFKEKYGEFPRADHMAIRSISGIGFGMEEANCLFSALGYKFGNYWPIPELNIMACHFEPPAEGLEKIFFSVVNLDKIEQITPAEENFKKIKKQILNNSIVDGVYYPLNFRNDVYELCQAIYLYLAWQHLFPPRYKPLERDLLWLLKLRVPEIKNLLEISQKQYLQEVAHVLAYGFMPNHFTFLMQDPTYKFPGYISMENLAREIAGLGIKMKDQVEGDEDSILCQTSTLAYLSKCKAYDKHEKKSKRIKWPMSYIEFIKRGADPASPTGRYEGFVPKQAQAIFRVTDNK